MTPFIKTFSHHAFGHQVCPSEQAVLITLLQGIMTELSLSS